MHSADNFFYLSHRAMKLLLRFIQKERLNEKNQRDDRLSREKREQKPIIVNMWEVLADHVVFRVRSVFCISRMV